MRKNEDSIGIYIHIPFCVSKCYYCDFNSHAGMEYLISDYFNALYRELSYYKNSLKGVQVKTLFIGGGTPSSVPISYIEKLMACCYDTFVFLLDSEVTIESNPGTLTREKLQEYRRSGINRLSMGLQAWQESLLKALGRIHTRNEFEKNYDEARNVGFSNMNVDLMFGIPSQTILQWQETLNQVISLQPEHLSCYSLKVEEDTLFGKWKNEGKLILPDDEIDRDMYRLACDMTGSHGYKHDEISNFSKDGFKCRHNNIYWTGQNYIGIGAGAHSYINHTRYGNLVSTQEYIQQVDQMHIEKLYSECYELSVSDEISEFMFLGLRLIPGISLLDFKNKFHKSLMEVFGTQIGELIDRGLLVRIEDRLKLTTLGLDLANQVFVEFV